MIFRAHSLVIFLLAVAVSVAQDSSNGVTSKDIQPTPAPDPTTSTITPTTVKPPPTTTTPPPTTAPPTTPSPPPTTPSPPPTTPTPAPTQPTPPPTTPSTTPAPTSAPTTPAPPPKDWVVRNMNGTVCIVAKMGLKITVPYNTVNNKSVMAEFEIKNVAEAHANGTCPEGLSQSLILTWPNVTSTFNFLRNRTNNNQYYLNNMQIDISVNNYTFPNNSFGNLSTIILKHNSVLFRLPVNNSYSCARTTKLLLNSTALKATVYGYLYLSDTHIQAFGNKTDATYYSAIECANPETPDIVPIAVGVILAGLVVVVLIAYLVGRRRAQSRGYLSM